MTFLKAITRSSLLSLALLSTLQASASNLTGATIGGSLTTYPAYVVANQFAQSAVVGNGVEFTGSVYIPTGPLTIDVSADFGPNTLKIVFTSPNEVAGISGPHLAGLSFSGLPASFTGFESSTYFCDPVLGNLCHLGTLSGLSEGYFSPGSFSVVFSKIVAGDTYIFSSPLTPPAVPEPSSFALLGTGLLGIAGGLRRGFTSRP